MNTEPNARPYWHHLLAVILRQRRFILWVTAIGSLACIVVILLRGPVYEATAHLAVVAERARMIVSPDPKTSTVSEGATEQDLHAEVALLHSDQLLREVVAAGQDKGVPSEPSDGIGVWIQEILGAPGTLYRSMHGVPSDPLADEVQTVRGRLEIQPVKGSNLIRISYRGGDPERAAALVNSLAERHVGRPATASPTDAGRFFERQQEVLYKSRRDAEQRLREFYEREGVGSPPENEKALREQVIQLQANAVKSRTALAKAEAEAQFLRKELEQRPTTVRGAKPAMGASSDPLQLVRSHIVDLELKRSRLLGQFAPGSSRIRDIDRQLERARSIQAREEREAQGIISQTRENLELALAKTEAEAAGLRARTEAMEAQIAEDQSRLVSLEQIAPERERLEQEVAAAREALGTYVRKQEEARFSSDLDRSRIVNVSIVESARVPTAPLVTARIPAVLLGTLFSLLAGVGFAFVRDRMDPSVKSTADAADITGAPIFADLTC